MCRRRVVRSSLPVSRPWRPVRATLLSVVLTLFVPLTAHAHRPHDPIDTLALSPAYGTDGIVFVSKIQGLKRSTDGGNTWKVLVSGLDNVSAITSVAISPSFAVDRTAFLATAGDGIYRSTDEGLSWAKVNTGLLDTNIDLVVASPEFGSGGIAVAVTATGELHESSDGGKSWYPVTSFGAQLTSLEFSPQFAEDGIILAGDVTGRLLSSRDGGSTWQQEPAFPAGARVTSIGISPDLGADGTVLVGTYGDGLYVTTDGLGSFDSTGSGIVDPFVLDVALSPAFATDGTFWASGKDQAVFVSRDRGATWELRNEGILHIDQGGLSKHHYRILAASESYAADGTVFLAAFEGLFKSTDGGETWRKRETNPPSSVKGAAVSPTYAEDGTLLLSTYGGGTYVSLDGGASWRAQNVGLEGNYTYDVAFSPAFAEDHGVFTVYQGAFCRSPNGGLRWYCVPIDKDGDVFPTCIAPSPGFAADQQIFFGTRDHGVYKSVDGGRTWRQVLPNVFGMGRIHSIVLSPGFTEDSTVFVGTQAGGVWRSMDGGSSWIVSLSVPNVHLAVSPNYALDATIFAGTAEGVYRSVDGGVDWLKLGDGEPFLQEGIVQAIAVSPDYHVDGTVFVGIRGHGLFLTHDGGESWRSAGPWLLDENFDLTDIAPSPAFASDRTLFGATGGNHGELLVSTDGADTWQFVSRPVRYESNNPSLNTEGSGWSEWLARRYFSGSSVIDSEQQGDALHLEIIGSTATWVGPVSPIHGKAEVVLDGVPMGTVDQYAQKPATGISLFTVDGLDPLMPHVLSIGVLGEKNPLSKGYHVTLDAVDVSP